MATQAKTYPDFSRPQPREVIWRMAEMAVTPDPVRQKIMEPAPDTRYPGYASMLQDGRFGTDYRPHCNSNVPPPYQFGSKKWMIHNSDEIINDSRRRQAEFTGAALVKSATKMPIPGFENVSMCSPFVCEIRDTPDIHDVRIGLYRGNGGAAPLFGTYTVEPTDSEARVGQVKNIPLTRTFEGGRNTPRGGSRYLHGAG